MGLIITPGQENTHTWFGTFAGADSYILPIPKDSSGTSWILYDLLCRVARLDNEGKEVYLNNAKFRWSVFTALTICEKEIYPLLQIHPVTALKDLVGDGKEIYGSVRNLVRESEGDISQHLSDPEGMRRDLTLAVLEQLPVWLFEIVSQFLYGLTLGKGVVLDIVFPVEFYNEFAPVLEKVVGSLPSYKESVTYTDDAGNEAVAEYIHHTACIYGKNRRAHKIFAASYHPEEGRYIIDGVPVRTTAANEEPTSEIEEPPVATEPTAE